MRGGRGTGREMEGVSERREGHWKRGWCVRGGRGTKREMEGVCERREGHWKRDGGGV